MLEFLRKRSWAALVLFAIGGLLIGYSLVANLTRTDPQEFHFSLTIDKLGPSFQTRAAGARKLYGKQFYFEGERISFLGEIEGGYLTLKGTVRSGDKETKTRDFKAEGKIADNRMTTAVVTDKGSKIGHIEFEF
jgi:hypothetical protein